MEVNRSVLIQENRQINIQLEQSGNRAMAQKGLTAIQAHILLYILDHSDRGISLTDIHREFGYSRDDRKKILFGTDKGKEAREFLDRAICEAQNQLYSGFSPEELATLDRLQKKMLQNLSTLTQNHSKEVSKS